MLPQRRLRKRRQNQRRVSLPWQRDPNLLIRWAPQNPLLRQRVLPLWPLRLQEVSLLPRQEEAAEEEAVRRILERPRILNRSNSIPSR
jgi:hypothetical protein